MRVLKLLIAASFAALILLFAYANRDKVTIGFDPIGVSGLTPLQAPQYAVLLVVAALGVIAGSVITWLDQGKHRRALREAESEAARLRQELNAQRFSAPPTLTRQA